MIEIHQEPKRPDAAPPKDCLVPGRAYPPESCGCPVCWPRYHPDRAAPKGHPDLEEVFMVTPAAPPSDAAPVSGAFAVALADGFRNMGNDGSGDDVSHPANWSLGAWVVYAVEVTKLYGHPEDAPGGPSRLDVERVLASMLSVIHTWHGDVAWEIYRDNAPELADYRAFVDRLKGDAPTEGEKDG